VKSFHQVAIVRRLNHYCMIDNRQPRRVPRACVQCTPWRLWRCSFHQSPLITLSVIITQTPTPTDRHTRTERQTNVKIRATLSAHADSSLKEVQLQSLTRSRWLQLQQIATSRPAATLWHFITSSFFSGQQGDNEWLLILAKCVEPSEVGRHQ